MLRPFFKKIYESSDIGYHLINPFLEIYKYCKYNLKSDREILAKRFQKAFDRKIDFDNPKTLNEKIIWLKLNDRTSLHTQCADKYAVRSYIKEKIGDTYLIPLYLNTENVADITYDNIEHTPCIIKANHDSDGGIFIYDKNDIDFSSVQRTLKKRLRRNHYQSSKEWQYKNIKPSIVVEKLLQDKQGNIPSDYKLHCFNGEVRMISVDIGRDTKNHTRNWYTTGWEREIYKWSSPKENGLFTDPSDKDIPKPESLDKMISLSEILSKPFDYVRVDWYDVDGKLYFGELTFHHDGGLKPIIPQEWDYKLGDQLRLSNLNKK